MTVASIDSVERSVHKTNAWLSELEGELRGSADREEAWRVLRAYLQLLRDQLNVDEAAQLAAQLPHLIRGVFYEGFDPGRQPARVRDRDEFAALLAERARLDGPGEAVHALAAANRVLRRHVTAGEVDDVLSQLPAGLREALQAD